VKKKIIHETSLTLVNYRLSKVFQFSTKLKPLDPTKLDEENPVVALCRSL